MAAVRHIGFACAYLDHPQRILVLTVVIVVHNLTGIDAVLSIIGLCKF